MLAIRDIEVVIGRAIAGEAPDAAHWGSLTATELLRVIHDVTTWSAAGFPP